MVTLGHSELKSSHSFLVVETIFCQFHWKYNIHVVSFASLHLWELGWNQYNVYSIINLKNRAFVVLCCVDEALDKFVLDELKTVTTCFPALDSDEIWAFV